MAEHARFDEKELRYGGQTGKKAGERREEERDSTWELSVGTAVVKNCSGNKE